MIEIRETIINKIVHQETDMSTGEVSISTSPTPALKITMTYKDKNIIEDINSLISLLRENDVVPFTYKNDDEKVEFYITKRKEGF